MKAYFFIFFFTLFSFSIFAQFSSKVEKSSELVSIVFRLAEAKEYVNNNLVDYINDVDQHFSAYKDHPLISYTKEFRERYQVGYGSVAFLSRVIIVRDGKVALDPKIDIINNVVDESWSEEAVQEFVYLLSDFYTKANFESFFSKHESLYTQTEMRLDKVLSKIDTAWFGAFFGDPFGDPFVVINLCNGVSNYGLTISNKDNSTSYGAIIGCTSPDSLGVPVFDSTRIIPLLVHEFCHHFSNPLVAENAEILQPIAEKIFPFVEDKLRPKAYGHPDAIMPESFVRMCANAYFEQFPINMAEHIIKNDELSGFIWMRNKMRFLKNFTNNRSLYPTLRYFVPQITAYMNSVADNMEMELQEYALKTPRVIAIFPEVNSEVESTIKEIRIDFSQAMWTSSGIMGSEDEDRLAPDFTGEMDSWSEDRKTLILRVNLDKGKRYGFYLPFYAFSSMYLHNMKEDFEVKFQTK
ncbi:hypothetical protein AwDysgo_20410 [Bacteroidales bacterium]|nr:hypothetical protein AwDysgo_20410 [Bacteroidales bacterium]